MTSHEDVTGPAPSEDLEPASSSPLRDGPGDTIGPYRLLEPIGEGGFGTVFVALQTEPVRRKVALKVIKLGMDTKQVVARFEAERQALALMDHPHIASVFGGGATSTGRPYFVMELVRGVPVTEYCDRHNLTTDQRLALFIDICQAVQHAHQKGIIHRDIKPSNVLVTDHDGRPLPKVIDFGVAKATNMRLTEQTIFTAHNQLIGTPAYMSPEQAEMNELDIDTRSDIYSLGVLLYELLTGTTPFDPRKLREAGYGEIQRIIREEDPPRPSTRLSTMGEKMSDVAKHRREEPSHLARSLRGDLDWIVMKALDKDRTRRYETATGLARDVQRHLDHEPVLASPPSVVYTIGKFVRRNSGAVIAGGVVAAVLVLGVAGTTTGMIRSMRASTRAEAEAAKAQEAAVIAAEQRVAAEASEARARTEAERAREAEAVAEERAAQLEQITSFQTGMLSDLEPETMGINVRQSLRRAIRERLEREDADAEKTAESLRRFDALMAMANPTNTALDVLDEQLLRRAARSVDTEFANQPRIAAALRQTLATSYRDLGLYDRALDLQQQALDTRRLELGADDKDTLASIHEMSRLLHAKGSLAEAERMCRAALLGRRRVLGDAHPDTLESTRVLSTILAGQGRLDAAERTARDALARARRTKGSDDPEILRALSTLGRVLQSQGRYDEAGKYLTEALEGRRRLHGDDHPRTLATIAAVGALLTRQGRYAEAEAFDREALEGCRRAHGDLHPQTLQMRNNLGLLLQSLGRLEEAEASYREALEGRREVLGESHPDTLTSINNMGWLLARREEYAEAEPYFSEALIGFRQTLGTDHPDTLTSVNNMGWLLARQEKYADAEPYYLQALEGFRRSLGDDHPSTLGAINNNAWLLTQMGRDAEAEAAYLTALEGRRVTLGDDHPDTLQSINNLGALLQKQRRLPEAEPYFSEALAIQQRTLGRDDPRTLNALNHLASVRVRLRRLDEAEPLYRELAEQHAATVGEDDPKTQSAVGWLGYVLREQGKFAEAEVACRRQLESRQRTLPAGDPAVASAMSSLALVLIRQDRHTEAEPLLRDCLEARRSALPADHWHIYNAMSLLGDSIAGQGRYTEAEPLLVEGYEKMSPPASGAKYRREALDRLVTFYESWEQAEPGVGHAEKGATWRTLRDAPPPGNGGG